MLTVASVNKTPEDEIDNDTCFIFFLIFEMKQNVSETVSNWHFQKNVKTCLQNKKSYLMLLSRHDHFHLILILHVKIVKLLQQHASTTVHWL